MSEIVVESTLTVYFDEPFWVGIYERISNGRYEVCKITFGSEPSSQEVWLYLLKHWSHFKFSQSIKPDFRKCEYKNPKRQQRAIKRLTQEAGIGTKAQQILKMQYEQMKDDNKKQRKQEQQNEKDFKYKLHKEKQRMHHRGK